jgi:hypothetical protein
MRRPLKLSAVILLATCSSYAAVHARPAPLFPYQLAVGAVVLHAREPLPPNTEALLREVNAQLATSPLLRPGRQHDVFLCDTPALYAFFSPHHPSTGGETYTWWGNVIFLRPARVADDRLLGPSGAPVPGARTLTYFLTHELVHALTADELGVASYLRLERWQQDGYADYVANPHALDAADTLERFRAGDVAFDPERSGLYLRYQLLVTQLLRGGLSVEDLLSTPRPAGPVEAELRQPSAR